MKQISFENIDLAGFWESKQNTNRDVTMPVIYKQFYDSGRITAFACDWKPGDEKKPHYFWDSDVAKWIEGVAYSLINAPDENLEEVIDSKLYITTTNSSFTLNCNNANEFPDLELEFNATPIVLNQKQFKTIINQTSFATSTSETRPVLTGINFKIEDNILECTATDSYRLAIKRIILPNKVNEKSNIIIPTKNLNELIKLMNNDEEDVEMHIFGNKVVFKLSEITMMTRLISGTYPDTSKLIPETFELTMNVNYNDFYNAIDRASLLTSESDKNTIKFESNNEIALISSNIPEIRNVEEKIKVEKDNEQEIKIAFNSRFMMEAIRAIESDEIKLMFNGEIKPIILKNSESDDLIQLILPIRTY